ncbi:MAG TPA: hypothetical protein DIT04_02510, partial [Dysgonomonas sp.]|nr:hypothetical protein [Dysgonomonas sp.]
PAGLNGSSVKVVEETDHLVIISMDSEGSETGRYNVPKGSMVVMETDYWVELSVNKNNVKTLYRIGKLNVLPVAVKIIDPVIEGVEKDGTYKLKISVSPSDALVKKELVYFDYTGEGIVTRSTSPDEYQFTNDFFEIIDFEKASREGEYIISFDANPAVENAGGNTMGSGSVPPLAMVYGEKLDVCLAYVRNPASISRIIDSGNTPVFTVEYGYCRSVNSFTFTEPVEFGNSIVASPDFIYGKGTQEDPYIIYSAGDLKKLVEDVN